MTTVGAVIDRIYRTMLTPPDFQPAGTTLLTDMLVDATTLRLAAFIVPEDEQLLRTGSIIEVDKELMRVLEYAPALRDATVERGVFGTPVTAHTAGKYIILSPSYPRQSVFESVADNIITLYPKLYTVSAENLISIAGNIAGIPDDLAVEVVSVWPNGYTSAVDIDARIVEYHPAVGGRAVVTNVDTGQIWLRYRRRMGKATTETDTLESLGVDERWVNIIMAGVGADLFSGRDLPASHVEWVGGVLQAENIPVGTRQSLSVGLVRYRELLIDRAAKEMKGEDANKVKVHMSDPLAFVT